MSLPHIVIVGGGAGGLELAALLGRRFGKNKKAIITLIDASPTHIWKPLLHEVAAGTMNSFEDEVNYLAFASQHFFQFTLGTLNSLNRSNKEITLSPILNLKDEEVIPSRTISYDVLIIAVGSVANDFNIPGVREYCLFLDNRMQADFFHQTLLSKLMQRAYKTEKVDSPFNIAIVGGGATGIELIAELHNSIRMMTTLGMAIQPNQITFTLVEASTQLLPALPEILSKKVSEQLQRLDVQIYLNEMVTQVTPDALLTRSGKSIAADMMVWTAGIKAPEFLKHLDHLEVNKANQLVVKQTLQTTQDPHIFAFGDCASCPQTSTDKQVPPRAQAAHQQAKFLVKALQAYLANKPLPLYHYHDYGSLITISHYQVIGNLMGRMTRSIPVEGKLARLFYLSLYKQHQIALFGPWRVMLLTLANFLSRKVKPRLKLH